MHDDRVALERRIDRVLNEWIRPAIYPATSPLDLEVWHVPDEPVPVEEALRADYQPFGIGQWWGRPWSTSWFRARGSIPSNWSGHTVEALIDLGFVGELSGGQAEALVYDREGRPLKGVAPGNQYVPIADVASGGEDVELLIEAAANPDLISSGFRPTLLGEKQTAGNRPQYRMNRADLAVFDEHVWHLALDIEVLTGVMRELALSDAHRFEILAALATSMDELDLADIASTATAARRRLAPQLARRAPASAHRISAVGHAHIDVAWLWPMRESVRKTSRTFANVVSLARSYPDFVFAASQAQQYEWMRTQQPDLFCAMRDAVKAGQWVPVGGMWVESDANLPSGEALVRQFVYGKKFFLDEFGTECTGVWLPDTFGFSAAFPQIARLAGMRWFMTQKLSWNDTNRMPHHTFWWEGIDGSRLFTHFPPIGTYAATLSGSEIAHAAREYAEKGRGTRSLAPFGHGDGGGGPTREMVERARRLASVEGSASVVMEHPDSFFQAAESEYPDAPVWSGELYLELHRGTFTSQARTKIGNRRAEHLLREVELWSTQAAVAAGQEYPYDELERLWKIALVHQFHDILPGSSIAWVRREAEAAYSQLCIDIENLIDKAVTAVANAASGTGSGAAPHPWIFNASPWDRTTVAVFPPERLEGQLASTSSGVQRLSDGSTAVHARMPGHSASRLEPRKPASPVTVVGSVMDNGLVRVELDERGLLVSLRDLAAGREVIAPGSGGNLLQLHPDYPSQWDAWDIDRSYRAQVKDLLIADVVDIVDRGPLVGSIRVVRTVGDTRVIQTITVRAGSRRVDIATEADWQERQRILKAAFPLDVHADRTAAEIQFGHVMRPLHVNTSWEAARFESYAHRFIHVAEPGYGVGLLTDATYGFDAGRHTRPDGGTTTTVRLSLLRSARFPDPDADIGRHRFRYALLPGAALDETIAEGYALNIPPRLAAGPGTGPARTWLHTSEPAVVVDTVKLAEDRSGDVIVRLYESLGGRARAELRVPFGLASVEAVDLLERPLPNTQRLEHSTVAGNRSAVDVTLRPFQVLTLRLRRRRSSPRRRAVRPD